MSILDKLIEIICLAEEVDKESLDESILNEKITSKKALRRKRRAARKAAKLAAEQKQQASDPEVVDAEVVDDGEFSTSTSLMVYDENNVTETPKDYSESFIKFMELFNNILEKYTPEWEKGQKLWEQAGKDKPCPEEAFKYLKQCIDGCQAEFKALMENEFPQLSDTMEPEELQYLEYQMTAVNGFLEKKAQIVNSIEPENVLDAETIEQISGEVQQELPGETTLALPGPTQKQTTDKDKRTKDKILTYDSWAKGNDKLNEAWGGIVKAAKKLGNTPFAEFLKSIPGGVGEWFEGKLWSFLTSPLAKDIVKAFMYCNPITAALFDGYVVDLGLKDGLDKVKAKRQESINKRKAKNASNKEKYKYDDKGLPQNFKEWKWEELKKEFFGNKDFVDLVNLCYNHTEVANKDKGELQRLAEATTRIFKTDKRSQIDTVRNNMTKMLDTVNKICDYMSWDKPGKINALKTAWSKWKGNKGNTQKDKEKIKNTRKKQQTPKTDTQSQGIDYDKLAQAIVKAQGENK